MNKLIPSLRHSDRLQAVLDYWFTPSWDRKSKSPESVLPKWFGIKYDENHKMSPLTKEEAEAVDGDIQKNFLEDLKLSALKDENGYFSSWREDPQGRLALIILQDQMARNIFRKKAEAFAYSELTLELVLEFVKNREDKNYKFYEKVFFYLPLEHSENIEHQNLSVELFGEMHKEVEGDENLKPVAANFLKFAIEHQEIVKKFGRFPHRNDVLNRPSTEEELKFLKDGGSRFGQ